MRARTKQASHPANGLAGATLVLTRPVGTAGAMRTAARARGAATVSLPGLSLRAAADMDAVRRRLGDAARSADAWLFSSPAAVAFAFRAAPSLRIPARSSAFGIGAGTLRALARHGVDGHAPPSRADSEGVLALPELANVAGRRIVMIGAPGGRYLIAPTLRKRGARVEAIHVYERHPPRLTQRHFDALASATDPLITLVSSGEALANLAAQVPAALLERLREQALVVSSARLAAVAGRHGFVDVHETASARPADLLAAAEKVLARHRL